MLRKDLIRLAAKNPELREHLLPILTASAPVILVDGVTSFRVNEEAADQIKTHPELEGSVLPTRTGFSVELAGTRIMFSRTSDREWFAFSANNASVADKLGDLIRVQPKPAPPSPLVGEDVYLDRTQCDTFDVGYTKSGTKLVIAADTLLKSKGGDGYDAKMGAMLRSAGGSTLILKGAGYGWFKIEKVIRSMWS